MGQDKKFIKTQDFRLDIGVDLATPTLRAHFLSASLKLNRPEQIREMMYGLTGRRDLDVSIGNEVKLSYNPEADRASLNSSALPLHAFIGVSRDNLPPAMPKEFTPELYLHLVAVHEAEHVTQYSIKKHPISGKVDIPSITLTMADVGEPDDFYSIAKIKIVQEADADLPVIQHAKDIGLENVAQFWQDARLIKSFVSHFPKSSLFSGSFDYETSAITSYYLETGHVLEPDFVIREKRKLIDSIRNEMSYDEKDFTKIINDFIGDKRKSQEFLSSELGRDICSIRPQAIMHSVNALLERNALEGYQKWEAVRFMEAAQRMGYKPETQTYLDQLRLAMAIELRIPNILKPDNGLIIPALQKDKPYIH